MKIETELFEDKIISKLSDVPKSGGLLSFEYWAILKLLKEHNIDAFYTALGHFVTDKEMEDADAWLRGH